MKKKLLASGTMLVVAALALSACSTSSDTGSNGSGPSASASLSADAQAALDKSIAGVGSDLALDPVTPASGINLYVVSCGEQTPGCSVPAAAVKTAAEKVGWTATIADGKLNPEGFATAIRQAVAGGASVIVPIGIGCGVAAAAFKEAVEIGRAHV